MKKSRDIKKEMSELASQRSSVYGFLARVYSRELNSALLNRIQDPRFMGVLFDLEVQLGDEFFSRPKHELLENLAVEYTRLFLGPGRHISPHESMHHQRNDGDWGKLWGASTVEVKKFIESAGLHYKPEYTGLPDHISVELEFMQVLTKEESRAWNRNDMDRVHYCCQIEKKFMNEHLLKWVHIFCNKVISDAGMSFYREIAAITKNFMELENEELGGCYSKAYEEQLLKARN
ncbi:MAG: hypothetical protein C4538_04295 [Nitrospiraceae bacterium]|nr:MAG: hypothetical protein C4538_04295 [Nitrospiraceae bacterium]